MSSANPQQNSNNDPIQVMRAVHTKAKKNPTLSLAFLFLETEP